MSELDLDLTVDMIPPKDPYIKVHLVDDIGEVLLDDQSASLMHNSMHCIKVQWQKEVKNSAVGGNLLILKSHNFKF